MTRTASKSGRSSRVLIVGGGVAALEGMLALRELAASLLDIELVSPEHQFFYRPLAVAEPFGAARVGHWEIADLARSAGANFTPGALKAVSVDAHAAELESGQTISYDAVLLACGARPITAVDGALTFRGPADVERFGSLLERMRTGEAKSLVFAVPSGIVWPLPLYELALQTAAELDRAKREASLTLVTAERAPLAIFGEAASNAVAGLLRSRGITAHVRTYPTQVRDGRLLCGPGAGFAADGVVALPRLTGPALGGVPRDRNGFVPTDSHGRVLGAQDVYAAGDLTGFPIKQGGLAAQQADAAAETIAASLGAGVEPKPFQPTLRALLLTGGAPTFLAVELGGGHGETSTTSVEAPWSTPGKIVGRRLGPFLAERGLLASAAGSDDSEVLRIEAETATLHELPFG